MLYAAFPPKAILFLMLNFGRSPDFRFATPSRFGSGFFVENHSAIYSCGDSLGFSPNSLLVPISWKPKFLQI